MLWIFKPKIISNLAHRFVGVKNSFFSNVDQFRLYIFQRCFPGFFFNQVAEIIWRQVQLFCAIGNRWQPHHLRFIAFKIIIEHLLKLLQYAVVHMIAGSIICSIV